MIDVPHLAAKAITPVATYQILAWHGIPTQVRAKDGASRAGISVQLPARFQDAIDHAAMAAKLTGSDDYTAGFAWGERLEREGTAQQVAAAIAAELDAQYPELDWRALAATLKTQT